MKKKVLFLIVASLASAVLLSLAWPPLPLAPLLFIALVPLLFLEDYHERNRLSFLSYFAVIYLCLLIWNISVTFWLYNTTKLGALIIHLINPIILSVPWLLYKSVKRKWGLFYGSLCLICSWVSIETLHHNWQLAFPFMTLGNGLSMWPEWIQFYEYTGVLGGSVWIIVINILLFYALRTVDIPGGIYKISPKRTAIPLAALSIPLSISLIIFNTYEHEGQEVNVLVVHPNTDCRNEKYNVSTEVLIDKYLGLTFEMLNEDTDYILWPETAITNAGWIEDLSTNELYVDLSRKLSKFPDVKLVTGAVLYELYKPLKGEDISNAPDIRYAEQPDLWYYTYNSAIHIDPSTSKLNFRTKNKLVPMEETIPYAKEFSLLQLIFYLRTLFNKTIVQSN